MFSIFRSNTTAFGFAMAGALALALLASGAAGYRLAIGAWPDWAALTSGDGPGAADHGKTSAGASKERKILYYRNPMGLPDTSPVPKKDWMGMDFIAVYEGEEEGDGSTVKISLDRVQRSGVRTELAQKRRLVRPVRAPGVAKPDERTMHTVTLRADGFIEKLYVEETGAHIKAGQPLFRIYSPAMVNAQVDYRIGLPDSSARGHRSNLEGAEQKLRNLEVPNAVLKEMRRTGKPVMSFDWPSPADGYVMKKNVIEGQMVRMGEEIFRIAGLENIWIIADVSEQDIGLVAVGQPSKGASPSSCTSSARRRAPQRCASKSIIPNTASSTKCTPT